MAGASVNDLVTVITQVVDRHMRDHRELEATPDAVAALQVLILAAAQRLAGDPALADPQAVAVENTQLLMDAVTDIAHADDGPAEGASTARLLVTGPVVSAAVERDCPLWPFCSPEQ